jgi:hypothetical protein
MKKIFYELEPYIIWILKIIFPCDKTKNHTEIPIIINNFNRLECLKLLIERLDVLGYTNVYILDNNSSYPPLLEYYKTCELNVIRLKKNHGHLSLWKSMKFLKFINDYYVYTDPDVIPIKECPENFLKVFKKELESNRKLKKIGLSLKIDDLPDTYKDKEEVINWERQFSEVRVSELFFKAPVDTTFALYKPWSWAGASSRHLHYRSDYPYQARHLPWYSDSKNLSKEDKYYKASIEKSTHWSIKP